MKETTNKTRTIKARKEERIESQLGKGLLFRRDSPFLFDENPRSMRC